MTLLERQCWAALVSVPTIGAQTFKWLQRTVLRRGYSLVDLWFHWSSLGVELQLKPKHQGGLRVFQRQFTLDSYWEYLLERNITVVTDQDLSYPHLLAKCEDRPPILFVKGKHDFWNQNPVAIVGTRRVTSYGELVTKKIASELVTGGQATIVSGFMYGVDALAHQTALHQNGKTVGVLGFGFDHLYPRHHQELVSELLEKGSCLVTELAPMVPPTSGTFPVRNRIIAGLSLAVVVTEAAEQSGSHITAAHALEYGRLVAAVPGPITNHFSEGTKNLVKQGALMVSSGYEVLEELNLPFQKTGICLSPVQSELERAVIKELLIQTASLDELQERLQCERSELVLTITTMELEQKIKRVGELWSVV